jgi:hypothetical protein
MNSIAIVEQAGNPRFDIVVDGRRLAEHFVGRRGAHPGNVVPIGWRAADLSVERQTLQQLLGLAPSGLSSGRVAVLVCEECGDIGCGALAARIDRRASVVTWTDWAYENGYEPASDLSWPTDPESFEFDLKAYEQAFSNVVPGA